MSLESKSEKQIRETISSLRTRIGELEKAEERYKLSESARKQQEQWYCRLVNTANSIILRLDQTGRITFCNAFALDYFGYQEDEMLGRHVMDTIVPEQETTGRCLRPIIADILKNPDRYHNFINENVKRNGERVWVAWTNKHIDGDRKRAAGILCIGIDVTFSIRIVEALQESEERFSRAFQLSPAPTFITTIAEGRFIDFNDSAAKLLGYSRQEAVGRTVGELLVWENPGDRTDMMAKLSNHGVIQAEPIRLRTKSGDIKDVLWSCEVVKFYDEEVFLSLIYDMTALKHVETELRESERRLADIIDFLPDATFALDLTGRVIAWNRAIEEMTLVAARDILGKGDYAYAVPFYGTAEPIIIDLLLNQAIEIDKRYDVVKNENNLVIMETWVPCLKGERRYLWGKAGPLYNAEGKVVGAIESIRDITDRKLADDAIIAREAELQIKNRELEDLNAALRVLLKQRDNDQHDIEEKFLLNIKMLVEPYLEKMRHLAVGPEAAACLKVLDSNLKDIASSFTRTLSSRYMGLTNREIRIAHLIRDEKTSKEIAETLHISESAVNIHRYRIRHKLGLDKKHNLRAFLANLS